MESSTKHSKARPSSSQNAVSNVSAATHHAARKLHKHALHNSYDRIGRLKDKHITPISTSTSQLYHPGQVIADKISSKASSSKHGSAQPSRRPSPARLDEAEKAPIKLPQKPIRPADVARERQRQLRRDEELSSSLGELSDLAHNSSERLDNLYYAILEKVASLRSTIAKLQELSAASKKLLGDFQGEAEGFEADLKGQIAAFGDFEMQGKTIGELEGRIQAGMTRAKSLSDRLEAARNKVELWEQRENEWQARTSLRLRICSSCLGVFVVLILALLIFKCLTAPSSGSRTSTASLVNSSSTQISRIRNFNSSNINSKWADMTDKAQRSQKTTKIKEADPTLRAFDEL